MENSKRKLQIEQLDKKIKAFTKLKSLTPSYGWIYATRISLGMSLEQLGKKMGITAQSVREIEQREQSGGVSLKILNEAAKAFGLKLVYGFSSPKQSLEKMIDDRAYEVAKKIVLRTHKTMQLENQANAKSRLNKAIKQRAEEIANKNTKYLWD